MSERPLSDLEIIQRSLLNEKLKGRERPEITWDEWGIPMLDEDAEDD